MSFKRPQRHRKDKNEKPLLALARAIGIQWLQAPPLDGWAWHANLRAWYPVEIKDPKREGHADEYTPAQRKFFHLADLTGAPYYVWRTETDVTNFRRVTT